MTTFLCYDVKGIQSFIFAVPRLRYVIGGSALIDEFDRNVVPSLDREAHVYSAGGRGAFACKSRQRAEELREAIRVRAHLRGLDVAFGIDADFSRAANEGSELHPYAPLDLDGEPCVASGLFPVPPGKGRGYREDRRGVHEVVWKRIWRHADRKRSDVLAERLFAQRIRVPDALADQSLAFLSSVDAKDDQEVGDEGLGRAGAAALGGRNRWAVVAMDGNDMGAQFRAFFANAPSDEQTVDWLRRTSRAIDRCTVAACVAGIEAVLRAWTASTSFHVAAVRAGEDVILPIRPLVVGGDDLVVLVHPAHALDFVRAATERFAECAAHEHRTNGPLWLATDGQLSISAGVLWAPVRLPLATAMIYAESLLASAKHRGRTARGDSDGPAPACIDWESVTEAVVDTPAARRQRELRFTDGDLESGDIVELSRRPYTIEDLTGVQRLADRFVDEDVPRSLCHSILPSLRAGFEDRRVFVAQLAKRHRWIAELLDETREGAPKGSHWRVERRSDGKCVRSTDVVDAMLILQESRRIP